MKRAAIALTILLAAPSAHVRAAAELHPEVRAALDYQLPENTCDKPALIAQAATVVDGQGAREQTDVDSYTIDRFRRKEKRWQDCLDAYRQTLMNDFDRLKASASHGLTQAQADLILGKMKRLQSVYFSPEGKLEDP